ncbi:hypothetical protein EC988_002307 [Linderina pennispora]|nr:hypothetical protein EC988_002307 [Linderina pennispora]
MPADDRAEIPVDASSQTSPPPPRMPTPRFLYEGPVIASLVLFSMVGVLIRVHLNRLFTYDGAPAFALIWSQMVGCFIMGIASQLKGVLVSHSPALNLGITTGLCGSITTFSSWQLGVYDMFFNSQRYNHTRFKNFLGGMTEITVTLGGSVGAFRLGQMVGREIRLCYGAPARPLPTGLPIGRVDTGHFPVQPAARRAGWMSWSQWRLTDATLVIFAVLGTIATAVVIALAWHTRSVSVALLFGPIGTLLRWQLSKFNAKPPRFVPRVARNLPVGTFLANVFGSMVLSIVHLCQTGAVVGPSVPACYVLAAMADGFCGCLTTISTFTVEVTSLSSRRSMAYAAISIVVAQAFFLLINGIYFKTATVDYDTC